MFHKVDKVKIQILEFSKWKFEIQYFRLVETFAQSIEMVRKSIMESLLDSIAIRFLFDWSKRAFDQLKGTLNWLKLKITEFSVEFFSDCSESLKRFQALWKVLWNILTLHMCFLMKYNPMGINRGLCSLEILLLFSRIAICRTQQLGCILRTNLR